MSDVKNLRERYKLTRQQFSDLFCIPVRTVQSWELGERSCPLYVFIMMEELLCIWDAQGELGSLTPKHPFAEDDDCLV